MAHQVGWSDRAVDDVDQIAAYISRDSAEYAHRVVDRILQASRSLQDFPARGRVVADIGADSIRELPMYNFRLIYRIDGNVVTILTVVHVARKIGNLVDQ
mgnify:CR=1 FL=1